MKKQLRKLLLVAFCLCLTAGILTACGGSGNSSNGGGSSADGLVLKGTTWHCQDYYEFNEDGTVNVYDADGVLMRSAAGGYTWNGTNGDMEANGKSFELSIDESDGTLYGKDAEGNSYYFSKVSAPPSPEEPSYAASGGIANTAWNYGLERLEFYSDGTVKHITSGGSTYYEVSGSYEWDEGTGSGNFTVDGKTLDIRLDDEGHLLKQDENDYTMFHEYEKDSSFDESNAGSSVQLVPESSIDLANTYWEYTGFLGFYPDGSVWEYDFTGAANEDASGEYSWSGTSGWMTMHGETWNLRLEDGYLVVEGDEVVYFSKVDQLPS